MRSLARTAWFAVVVLCAAGCNKSATPSNNQNPGAAQPSSPQSSAPNSSAPDANAPNSAAPNSANSAAQQAPAEQPAPQPAPEPIVIPAGRMLSVTVDQSISSKTANEGDHFDASLAESVRVNGETVLRHGTRCRGVITDAKSAGRFKGHAELGLALESVTVDGKTYEIRTSDVQESSKGRGKRTGIGAGGGAAFGAIVGAIAGGGKGAAIGALAGGGAGSAGAAFTGKRDIEIPAETALDFKLARSVTITREKGQ